MRVVGVVSSVLCLLSTTVSTERSKCKIDNRGPLHYFASMSRVQTTLWLVACLAAGGLVIPSSYLSLWAMRSSFIGGYQEFKADCERSSGQEISADMEVDAATILASRPKLKADVNCDEFLGGVAVYREAIFNRSIGFGVVVFIGLTIVRFAMFPGDRSPKWIEEA